MPLQNRVRRAEKPASTRPPVVRLPPWMRHGLRTAVHVALDALAVAAAYRLAFWARFEWAWLVARVPLSGDPVAWDNYQGLLYAAVPIWLLLLKSNRVYTASYMTTADRVIQVATSAAPRSDGSQGACPIAGRPSSTSSQK